MGNSLKNYLKSAGIGALTGGVMGQFNMTKPFAAAGSALAGAAVNKDNRLGGAAAGAAGGALGGAIGGGIKSSMSGGQFGTGMGQGFNSYVGSIPGFGGYGTSNPTGMFSKMMAPKALATPTSFAQTPIFKQPQGNLSFKGISSGLTPASNFMSTASGTGGYTPPGSINVSPLVRQGIVGGAGGGAAQNQTAMDMFKNMLPGLAVSGAGSLFAPKVAAPDFSGIIGDMEGRLAVGGDPEARAAAKGYFTGTLADPIGKSAESGLSNAKLIADRQRAEDIRNLNQQFAAAMPGADYTNSSEYQNAMTKLNAAADQNYAANAGTLQFQYDQQQQQNKLAAATALAGMDDKQLAYYASLANLSAEQIMMKTGMDVENANSIKNIASYAGQLMMQKSLGLNQGVKTA